MKATLLVLALCLAVAAVPTPPAEAHIAVCPLGDIRCAVQCVVDHLLDPLDLPHICAFILA